MLQLLELPQFQDVRLFVSCFEIYGGACCLPENSYSVSKKHTRRRYSKPGCYFGPCREAGCRGAGKLYDLLNGRKHLIAREGRNKEICIVALREYLVDCSELIEGLIQHAAESRTTGSTGLPPTCPPARLPA